MIRWIKNQWRHQGLPALRMLAGTENPSRRVFGRRGDIAGIAQTKTALSALCVALALAILFSPLPIPFAWPMLGLLTWTNDANFTAVENCAVSGGSVALLPYSNDCSALTDFTLANTSAGTIDVTTNPGAITIACNTTNSSFAPSGVFTGPYAKLNKAMNGDFDVIAEVEMGANVNANYEGSYLIYYVDASNFVRVGRLINSTGKANLTKVVSGNGVDVASVDATSTSLWYRLVRSGNTFTGYYSTDGSAWTSVGSTTAAIGTAGNILLGAATYNTSGSCTVQFKTLTFLAGPYSASGAFTVHDSGVSYIDAGLGFGLDLSTLAKTHTAGATISAEYYHSNNAGDTPSYTSYTWAELVALAANGHRYHWLRFTIANSGAAASLDELTVDTYEVDVVAPGDPTSTKFIQFETDNFALIWTEPEDDTGGTGLSHIELRCDVGGSTYYLGVGASGPEWQASPTSYWKFKEGLGGSGITPASDYIDESASGARAYYARAVDNAGNKSAWTAFSAGVVLASTAPTSLAITDAGDGLTWQVTAAGTATGAAILLYNSSTDALVAILDASAKTRDLTAGIDVYAKALEPGKELSARYPSATGVSVPTLTSNFGTDASNLKSGAATLTYVNNNDGTVTFTVTGATAGTLSEIYDEAVGETVWGVAVASFAENGSATVTLAAGASWAKVRSVGSGGSTDSVPIRVTCSDSAAGYVRSEFGEERLEADEELFDEQGVDAVYSRGADSIAPAHGLIPGRAMAVTQDGGDVYVGTCSFRMLCDELDFGEGVSEPAEGDRITIGSTVYVVCGRAESSPERLVWTIPAKLAEGVA